VYLATSDWLEVEPSWRCVALPIDDVQSNDYG
jgi:hypothetical protein